MMVTKFKSDRGNEMICNVPTGHFVTIAKWKNPKLGISTHLVERSSKVSRIFARSIMVNRLKSLVRTYDPKNTKSVDMWGPISLEILIGFFIIVTKLTQDDEYAICPESTQGLFDHAHSVNFVTRPRSMRLGVASALRTGLGNVDSMPRPTSSQVNIIVTKSDRYEYAMSRASQGHHIQSVHFVTSYKKHRLPILWLNLGMLLVRSLVASSQVNFVNKKEMV